MHYCMQFMYDALFMLLYFPKSLHLAILIEMTLHSLAGGNKKMFMYAS